VNNVFHYQYEMEEKSTWRQKSGGASNISHKKWRLSALPKDLVKWFIFLWPYPIGSAANVMNNYFVAVYDVETVHVTVADPEVRWVETNSPSPRVIVQIAIYNAKLTKYWFAFFHNTSLIHYGVTYGRLPASGDFASEPFGDFCPPEP